MSTEQRTLNIDGMHCEHCVDLVEDVLEGLDGVRVESVGIGSAEVSYDATEVSVDQLASSLDSAGYELTA